MSSLIRLALIAGLAGAYATVPTTADAGEYLKCEGKKDEAKCNKKYGKWLAKEKARSTPYQPSAMNEKLAAWDAEDKNPFATDDWYFGSHKVGLESVDALLGEVEKAQALIKMAKYVGHIHKAGQKDEAKEIAGIILPDLIALKDIVPTLQEQLAKLQAELPQVAKDNPKLLLPATKAVGQTVAALGKVPADIPGAMKAVVPLAKGAPAAAKTMAVEAVEEKVTGGKKGKKR